MLNMIPAMQRGDPQWSELKAVGVGWWIRNINTLRKMVEKVTCTDPLTLPAPTLLCLTPSVQPLPTATHVTVLCVCVCVCLCLCVQVGKAAFMRNNDPLDAALFFLAMKKKAVLWGLFR